MRASVTLFLFALFVSVAVPVEAEDFDASVNATTAKIDDRVIALWQASGISPAQKCTDGDFVRRLYLDLANKSSKRIGQHASYASSADFSPDGHSLASFDLLSRTLSETAKLLSHSGRTKID